MVFLTIRLAAPLMALQGPRIDGEPQSLPSDLAAFLDGDTIDRAIEHGRPLELPPRIGITYRAFTDASGGRGDSYCVALAHAEPERHVVDVIRGVQPPFDPIEVTQTFAKLCRDYRVYEIVGDRFGADWVSQAWEKCGIRYKSSEKNKSELYLEALPSFSRGIVRLPDHPRLLRELRMLERQTHRSGRDTVDHPRGGSDDHANVVCGVLTSLSGGSTYLERITKAFSLDDDDKRSLADRNLQSIYAGFAVGRRF